MRNALIANFKKALTFTLGLALSIGLLASCGSSATPTDQDALTIGVVQFADHPSLKNCYDGLLEGLKAKGYEVGKNLTVDYQVAQAKTDLTNQIVQNFVSKRYDLIVGIATSAAQAAYNAASDKGIPVVFSAVTDPVLAELQNADGSNKVGVTGTSDELPIQNQLELIRAFMPDASKIGILYSSSEANSESSIKTYQQLAPAMGFEIVAQSVVDSADIPAASQALVGKVDAISNLTDNTVVQNLQIILNKAGTAGIPVFGSEEEQVTNGCLAAAGLDYIALGKTTGEMSGDILSGTKAEAIPVAIFQESQPFYNSEVMTSLGLELPASMASATDLGK